MPRLPRAHRALALALVLAAVALAGCGASQGAPGAVPRSVERRFAVVRLPATRDATLILDFVPNAVHAGIYRAERAGYYAAAGIRLRIVPPASTADTLRLIDAGRADVGLADAIDVAGQVDRGRDARAILALTQRPSGGLIASAAVATPRQLAGRTVGITGVPSDTAVFRTIVAHAGGDPNRSRLVTLGFGGVQALENGRVAAFTGYWPADGVQANVDGTRTRAFKLDEWGGPPAPGLVAFTTNRRIRDDAPLLRAFVAATTAGYGDVVRDERTGLDALLALNPALRRRLTKAQLDAYLPLFTRGATRFGELRPAAFAALAGFLRQTGLVRRSLAPSTLYTDRFTAR